MNRNRYEVMNVGIYKWSNTNRMISADSIVPDPANPQSFNRYAYALNNPVNRVDPTGHCSFDAQEIIDRWDCTLDEFDAMPIADRGRWMEQFMQQVPAAADWFNNIVGIIRGFEQYGLAESGSWLSIVDAAILQGIQDGYAQSTSRTSSGSGNWGTPKWQGFFNSLLFAGADESELINQWGTAEAAATSYGVEVASNRGLSPNGYERFFLFTGDIYRGAASSFEGGLGTLGAWGGAFLGVFAGTGDAILALDVDPIRTYGELGMTAGYQLGAFFNDPRSQWRGASPVYWYSSIIWQNQEGHRWP